MNERSSLPLHRRLSARLSLGMLLVLATALSAAGLWLGIQEQRNFQQQHREHAARTAAIVARALSERMLAGGGAAVWNGIAEKSEELRVGAEAARILVLTRGGEVKTSTDAAYAGRRFDRERDAECADCHGQQMKPFPTAVTLRLAEGERVLRVVSPIPRQPACVRCHTADEAFRGMIAIDFDRAPLEQAATRRSRLFLGIGIVSGLAMFGLLYALLRRLVHRPIDALTAGAGRIGAGDLAARVPVARDDELGQLTRNFNGMAGHLQEQVAQLKTANMELNLLYQLVVEVSRNMEITRMQSAVLHILRERLRLERLIFCVAAQEGAWTSAIVGPNGEETRVSGSGRFAELLARDTARGDMLPGVPGSVVAEATARRIVHTVIDGVGHFALPMLSRDELVGVLAGRYTPGPDAAVDMKLLENLAAHIGLAIENAMNFTQAITDGLTGLYNKRYGLARLDEALYGARRYRYPLSLLMLDIDHFKRVNDEHGHLIGDAVLKEVSRRLASGARRSDMVVRYGGEEFTVILPHTTFADAQMLGERIRLAVAQAPIPIGEGKPPLAVTVSVGATSYRPDTDNSESLIGRADQALYQAKQSGRNRVVAQP